MELKDYVSIMRRRWTSIVVVTLAVIAATAVVTMTLTPKYTGTTRLFFGVQSGESVTDLAQGSNFTEKQMVSYADVVKSPLVLDKVIAQLKLDETAGTLTESVTSSAQANTVILSISVLDSNPNRAAQIANSIGEQLTTVVKDLSPGRTDGEQTVRATVLAKAQVPLAPSSPNLFRNFGFGALTGLLAGCGVAILRHMLDTRVRSEDDAKNITDQAVLGVIPFDSETPLHPVVMHDAALGGRSEAVRRLRTNLQFVEAAGDLKSMVISSSIAGEGKSTTALNLAVSLSDYGHKVLLVDADLRRPSIAGYLGLEGNAGLTSVLIGKASLEDVVQPWQDSGLDVLPSGQVPPNPSELLGSPAMVNFLKEATNRYDKVVFDTAPLLPVTDAAVLSKLAGGTLIVVGVDRVHREQLKRSIHSLHTVGVSILGVVINKMAKRDSADYGYEYGYSTYAADVEALTKHDSFEDLANDDPRNGPISTELNGSEREHSSIGPRGTE